jgi:hypothetical protein
MTFVKIIDEIVYLFSIYNKGDKDNITIEEITTILKNEDLL